MGKCDETMGVNMEEVQCMHILSLGFVHLLFARRLIGQRQRSDC